MESTTIQLDHEATKLITKCFTLFNLNGPNYLRISLLT
jgi:hypothetical protein